MFKYIFNNKYEFHSCIGMLLKLFAVRANVKSPAFVRCDRSGVIRLAWLNFGTQSGLVEMICNTNFNHISHNLLRFHLRLGRFCWLRIVRTISDFQMVQWTSYLWLHEVRWFRGGACGTCQDIPGCTLWIPAWNPDNCYWNWC